MDGARGGGLTLGVAHVTLVRPRCILGQGEDLQQGPLSITCVLTQTFNEQTGSEQRLCLQVKHSSFQNDFIP